MLAVGANGMQATTHVLERLQLERATFNTTYYLVEWMGWDGGQITHAHVTSGMLACSSRILRGVWCGSIGGGDGGCMLLLHIIPHCAMGGVHAAVASGFACTCCGCVCPAAESLCVSLCAGVLLALSCCCIGVGEVVYPHPARRLQHTRHTYTCAYKHPAFCIAQRPQPVHHNHQPRAGIAGS